jgi:hypothetical protein
MLIAIIAFFESAVGKFALYAIGALAAIGIMAGVYFSWRNDIRGDAIAEQNQKMMEQVIKDQKTLSDQLAAIQVISDQAVKSLADSADKLSQSSDSITTWLQTPDVKKLDKPVSPIIKGVIERLKDEDKK